MKDIEILALLFTLSIFIISIVFAIIFSDIKHLKEKSNTLKNDNIKTFAFLDSFMEYFDLSYKTIKDIRRPGPTAFTEEIVEYKVSLKEIENDK